MAPHENKMHDINTQRRRAMNTITFESIRRDLVARLYAIAYTLDASVREGSGALMLGLPVSDEGHWAWPSYDEFDLTDFDMEETLRDLYEYAHLGRQKHGSDVFDEDEETGDLGRILAVIRMSDAESCEVNLRCDIAERFDSPDQPRGGLLDTITMYEARRALDRGEELRLEDVARLAGVEPSNMRNALYRGEAGRIEAVKRDDTYMVRAAEALRWLRQRKGSRFVETSWAGKAKRTPLPTGLAKQEIVPFIDQRIGELYQDVHLAEDWNRFLRKEMPLEEVRTEEGSRYGKAGATVGWSRERVELLVQGSVLDLQPDDLAAIARMLRVDYHWFASQVLRAQGLENTAIEDALSKTAPEPVKATTRAIADAEGRAALEVTLSAACIKHGYLDIQSAFIREFFPEACRGFRSTQDQGEKVVWRFDGKTESSDIRKKSSAFYSPRTRFGAWFKKLRAQPGDVITVHRIEERAYELTFSPKSN